MPGVAGRAFVVQREREPAAGGPLGMRALAVLALLLAARGAGHRRLTR